MGLHEEPVVRAIYHAAHPDWPEQSLLWYQAHPTLVVGDNDLHILGFTSFSIGPDDLGLVIYGADLCVLPGFRGKGYGRVLADERLRYGRDVGCTRFLGATQPENRPMRAIFEGQGFTELPLVVPHMFPQSEDAILYGGGI